ncbi:hypothetical protein LVISKB_0012 [Levilactobacillus brevis KB290]|uniref:Uncharacterized protein n=1 Tax=Levilactobacillus brevis KB290 TaxID=1001583 RepID=M5ABJ3_LEVBR|nr:hypothetical protein LVISKB_0012 [Levilactobacillus brevis KB290]
MQRLIPVPSSTDATGILIVSRETVITVSISANTEHKKTTNPKGQSSFRLLFANEWH